MINNSIFDENLYPMAWRLNSNDCRLTSEDKGKITFVNEVESENLWDLFFPFKKLMDIDSSFMSLLDKRELNFEKIEESAVFFSDKLNDISILFFLGAE